MSLVRRVLFLLLVLGALGNLGGGTGASFTAATTNDAATFATGSLVLYNQKDSGNLCFSTGDSVVPANFATFESGSVAVDAGNDGPVANCEALFNLKTAKPGDAATTVDLTLRNVGNLDGTLTAYTSGCTDAVNDQTPYHGSGNLCTVTQMTIQEYSDSARTTASACRYGDDANTDNVCEFNAAKTVGAFAASHPSGTPLALGTTAGRATRYFRISLQIASSLDNTFQGKAAQWPMTWKLDQA